MDSAAVDSCVCDDDLFFKNQQNCGLVAGAVFTLAYLCSLFKCCGLAVEHIKYCKLIEIISFILGLNPI